MEELRLYKEKCSQAAIQNFDDVGHQYLFLPGLLYKCRSLPYSVLLALEVSGFVRKFNYNTLDTDISKKLLKHFLNGMQSMIF